MKSKQLVFSLLLCSYAAPSACVEYVFNVHTAFNALIVASFKQNKITQNSYQLFTQQLKALTKHPF